MIYSVVSVLISVAVRQFFRRIGLVGEKPVDDGPVIYAPNHPNQAVDPFLVGTISARPVSFLAKSGLFKNPILGAFFRSLNMIPVYRPSDNEDPTKNQSSFREAIEILLQGKPLCVFPEGTSREERMLLPLKTGIARIALETESKAEWNLNLKIQPMSITYLSPRVFQSSVTITVGIPLVVTDYRAAYQQDPRTAVQQLTEELTDRLNAITVSVPNLLLQQDIEHITNLFDDDLDLRSRMQEVSRLSHQVAEKLPQETKQIQSELKDLYNEGYALGYFGVGSESLLQDDSHPIKHALVALGGILHLVPYNLTKLAIPRIVSDPHNLASAKIGIGALFYGLWYVLIFIGLQSIFGAFTSILLLILVMILGDFANRSTEATQVFFKSWFSRLLSSNKDSYHFRHQKFLENRERLKTKLLEISTAIENDFH